MHGGCDVSGAQGFTHLVNLVVKLVCGIYWVTPFFEKYRGLYTFNLIKPGTRSNAQ